MAGSMDTFKVILIIQAFFSLSITLLAHGLPASSLNYVEGYELVADKYNITGGEQELSGGLASQKNAPIIELGALVFYSGNILIDLITNFIFAIPEMLGLFIAGIGALFNFEPFFLAQVEIMAAGLILSLYILGLIQLLTSIRSGRVV